MLLFIRLAPEESSLPAPEEDSLTPEEGSLAPEEGSLLAPKEGSLVPEESSLLVLKEGSLLAGPKLPPKPPLSTIIGSSPFIPVASLFNGCEG
jgi:hypothetical protein